MSVAATIGQYVRTIAKPKNLHEMVSRDGLRAMRKLFELGALMAVVLPLQTLVAGPVFHDKDTVTQFMGRMMNRIIGFDVKFTGVKPVKDRPMIYIGNHLSWADSTVFGGTLPGAQVAKAETAKFPIVGAFGRAIGAIYVQKGAHVAGLRETHRQAAQTLNSGRSILIFPEGKSSDGTNVKEFKSGFLSVLFNNLSDVKLESEVDVQPFAVHVKSLDGHAVTKPEELADIYNWYANWTPENFWKVLKHKRMEIEIEGLPVMSPKDYTDVRQFTTAAEKVIKDRILAPRT